MGNLSSCTSSGFSSNSASSPPPPTLPPVARVLLLEGGALTFTFPIKVIKLLLDYPFHVICTLDSLRPGQHSLSSLLPDEELELGQLYLLLPLKTFENRQSMPSVLPLIRSKLDINPSENHPPAVNRQTSTPRMLTRSSYCANSAYSEDNFPANESAESAKLISSGEKSDMGFSNPESQSNNLYVGDSNLDKSGRNLDMIGREDDQKLRSVRLEQTQVDVGASSATEVCRKSFDFRARENQKCKKLTSMATFNGAAGCKERVKFTHNNNNNNVFRSRLCDTPELQMAYRSAMLRRCRSWTPRLQSITENKRLKSAYLIRGQYSHPRAE